MKGREGLIFEGQEKPADHWCSLVRQRHLETRLVPQVEFVAAPAQARTPLPA
jgi:hypothetical protein